MAFIGHEYPSNLTEGSVGKGKEKHFFCAGSVL